VDLSDVEWGDVLSDADGVLAVEGRVGDADVLVLRFADPGDRDAVASGLRADAAGPALPVLGSGEGWVILGVDDGFDALLEQRGFEAEASSDQPFG